MKRISVRFSCLILLLCLLHSRKSKHLVTIATVPVAIPIQEAPADVGDGDKPPNKERCDNCGKTHLPPCKATLCASCNKLHPPPCLLCSSCKKRGHSTKNCRSNKSTAAATPAASSGALQFQNVQNVRYYDLRGASGPGLAAILAPRQGGKTAGQKARAKERREAKKAARMLAQGESDKAGLPAEKQDSPDHDDLGAGGAAHAESMDETK